MKFLMTYAQRPDAPPPTPEHMAAIGAFTEKNVKAGIVLMTGGLGGMVLGLLLAILPFGSSCRVIALVLLLAGALSAGTGAW